MCIEWYLAEWGSAWLALAFGIGLVGMIAMKICENPANALLMVGFIAFVLSSSLAILTQHSQATDCECCVQQSPCNPKNCCPSYSPRQCCEPAPRCLPSEKARTPDQPTLYRF